MALVLTIVGLFTLWTVAFAGRTATVTFDVPGAPGIGTSYSEAGLNLTTPRGHFHIDDRDGDGDKELVHHIRRQSFVFDKGGASFDLNSIEVGRARASLSTFRSSSGAVVRPTSDGVVAFPTTGWSNITSFTWTISRSTGFVDNIVIDSKGGQAKVEVCHVTGSSNNPFVKIKIAEPALDAHLAHGDTLPIKGKSCKVVGK
jgi:hypothetical protein